MIDHMLHEGCDAMRSKSVAQRIKKGKRKCVVRSEWKRFKVALEDAHNSFVIKNSNIGSVKSIAAPTSIPRTIKHS